MAKLDVNYQDYINDLVSKINSDSSLPKSVVAVSIEDAMNQEFSSNGSLSEYEINIVYAGRSIMATNKPSSSGSGISFDLFVMVFVSMPFKYAFGGSSENYSSKMAEALYSIQKAVYSDRRSGINGKNWTMIKESMSSMSDDTLIYSQTYKIPVQMY